MIFEFSQGNEVIATMRAGNLNNALIKFSKALNLENEEKLKVDLMKGVLKARVFDTPVRECCQDSYEG